jgi:hypothetical protein
MIWQDDGAEKPGCCGRRKLWHGKLEENGAKGEK